MCIRAHPHSQAVGEFLLVAKILHDNVMRMKLYVKHSIDIRIDQASQEESTHHNVPSDDESESPSVPTNKQDE